ncbi:hypothetical protein AB0K87_14415 [Streptomyces sp. NPDC053705]|uniref:hypothetical protein n=1 Tax=Streptomyces sp. NPDC053705 TaxID=3156668 RepID=UPI00343966C6
MSILTLSDGRPVHLPPAVPTDYVFGCSDPDDLPLGEEVRAVVTLKVAMTRDMLATALNLACGASEEDPDSWDVAYIRQSVELCLAMEGPFTIQRDAEMHAELLDDPSVRDYIQANYRAVDRAYPHFAPKGNV